jgi:hypothetical protein
VELTEADLDYIYDFVTSEVHFLLTQYSHISFRTLQKCRQLYTCFKLYFGGVNQFTKNWFEQIAKQIVKGNTAENFIISTLKQASSRMKSLELVNLIMEHYSVGKTQAYDRLNLLKENGVIEGNREIILCNKNAN